ncbi:MAG: Fibronectin/fibrinogen-binding protein [Myxococcales bacterium]|nr:Fibronectin/fibrinogen-binding protein [Myxococcales bacterium]
MHTKCTARVGASQLTLKAAELEDVAREIARTLDGRVVQKVVQPDENTVLLSLRGSWLLLSADPRAGRMHLVDKPVGTGEAAPSFCMLLRKELTGLQLRRVDVVAGERAVELLFAYEGHERALRLFLYGPSARLMLVGDGRVFGSIGPGPNSDATLPPPRESAATRRFPTATPSAAIEAHYADAAGAAARVEAEAQRRAATKKLDRLVAALTKDRDRARAAVDKRKWGDLLLAHLHEIPRGAASVSLPDDFSDGSPLEIPLDPSLSARDNAARFYKEHKRMSRALDGIERRIAVAQASLDKLASGDFVATPRLSKAAGRKQRDERPPPFREFRSSTGTAILVGRGADRNDELTFKVAKGNDLWLHTRDVPGAHVVVPLSGRPVDGETLLDAATLAAHHSNARGETQVDIVYVLRKLVRKPPKSGPGSVTHSGGKTIRVRLEPARLERLLKSRVEEGR